MREPMQRTCRTLLRHTIPARMLVFYTILYAVPLLAISWWIWAHRRLRFVAKARWWQTAVAAFMLTFLICFAWMIVSRYRGTPWMPHPWLLATLMLWGMIFLPALAVPSMLGWYVWRGIRRFWFGLRRLRRQTVGHRQTGASPETDASSSASITLTQRPLTRRQMVAASLIAFPMIATLGTTAYSLPQKRRFRIREIEAAIPGLPEQLDGLRIAHVSDVHVGKFTRGEILTRIADATNHLDADFIVVTGDLIDHTVSDLPEALSMIHRMKPRNRIVMIEGNHDLFDGREAFERGVRDNTDVPLLLDEQVTIHAHGYPVQFLGVKWHSRGQSIAPHVNRVAHLRDSDAFPILLAHHPHAFDRAADYGLPFVLAGHTHGGQLMLTPEIGAGPAIFKYWSGLYRQANSSLVVSNGVGNWFPLRTYAPAEIVHLILRSVPKGPIMPHI